MKIKLQSSIIVSVFLLLIFIGCRQDVILQNEVKFDANTAKFQAVHLKDIPQVTKYIRDKTGRTDLKIPLKSKFSNSSLAKGNIDFGNLESSIIIKKAEDENTNYYIFDLENTGDEKTIYNFEVKEVGGDVVSAKVLEYFSNIPYESDAFGVLKNFNGTVTAYSLEEEIISTINFLDGQSPCPPGYQNPPGGGGENPGYGLPPEGGFPSNPGFPYYPSYPVGGGGGNSGGGDTGGGEDCDPNKWEIAHNLYEGGGLSGNIIGVEIRNDCGELKAVYFLSASANKLTAPCNDGSGVIILPNPKSATPCDRINFVTSSAQFKANVKDLFENKLGLGSETGYRMDNPTINNPNGNNIPLSSPVGQTSIIYTYFPGSTFAIIHTHYDSMNDPIFSPGDIIQFNAWLVAVKAWNAVPTNIPKVDLKNLSYTVVTRWGTYTFTYDGTGTDVVPFQNYTEDEMTALNKLYIKNVILPALTFGNVSGALTNVNNAKMEENFLNFARVNLNIPGMKLFKIENSGNTEIFLKPNNKRDTNKCN